MAIIKEWQKVSWNNVIITMFICKMILIRQKKSLYFNLGENKMHRIANEYVESDYKFVVQNGGRIWNKGKY